MNLQIIINLKRIPHETRKIRDLEDIVNRMNEELGLRRWQEDVITAFKHKRLFSRHKFILSLIKKKGINRIKYQREKNPQK